MTRARWLGVVVMAMLAASTFLNYLDRQVLALLSRPVQEALTMNDKGYAFVVTAFMVAYTSLSVRGLSPDVSAAWPMTRNSWR